MPFITLANEDSHFPHTSTSPDLVQGFRLQEAGPLVEEEEFLPEKDICDLISLEIHQHLPKHPVTPIRNTLKSACPHTPQPR